MERLEVTYPQQLSKFILQQLFELPFAQGKWVPFLASILAEGGNEEGYSCIDISHDDIWLKRREIQN